MEDKPMKETKNILIIEDDLDLVEAMKVSLGSEDYHVMTAYNPEEGLNKAKSEKPDLVILDVMFGSQGRTEGFDYAVKFKQDDKLAPVPILMISAVNVEHPGFGISADHDGDFLPIDDFIDKPAQPEELIRKVGALLEKGVSKWVNWPEKN